MKCEYEFARKNVEGRGLREVPVRGTAHINYSHVKGVLFRGRESSVWLARRGIEQNRMVKGLEC